MKTNLKSFLKTILKTLSAVFLAASFTCCSGSSMDLTKPLYSVTKPVYKSAAQDSACRIGGVYFELYNQAGSDIVKIETRMNVYDKKERKLLTGKTIITNNTISIPADASQKLCISLDEYITGFGEEGFYIDQFYVSLIEYSDGRVWKDNFGIYAVSGGE